MPQVAEIQSPRILGTLVGDDDNDTSIIRTPFRRGATPLTGGGSWQSPLSTRTTTIGATTRGGGGGGGWGQNTPPFGDNFRRVGGGRSGQQSVLPSWYPRASFGDVTDIRQGVGESDEFLTPQKKLLNSIDIVQKVVMKEMDRLKRTPSAKKAEREKKVKTLMSMR